MSIYQVTFNDKPGNAQEGWVSKQDTATIQITDGSGTHSETVSAQKFLEDTKYDSLMSPNDRLKMAEAGGGFGVTAGDNKISIPNLNLDPEKENNKVGPWAQGITDGAQKPYEIRQERIKNAKETVKDGTDFTTPLRDLMINKGLKAEDLSYKGKNIDEAALFLNENPSWSSSDLATFNRAMGNEGAANYLEKVAKGEPTLKIMTVIPITLPSDQSKKALEPHLESQRWEKFKENAAAFLETKSIEVDTQAFEYADFLNDMSLWTSDQKRQQELSPAEEFFNSMNRAHFNEPTRLDKLEQKFQLKLELKMREMRELKQ